MAPLNEGRSVNPGDTIGAGSLMVLVNGPERSTKAGASTPATPSVPCREVLVNGRRSTKAGASTPATRVHREVASVIGHRRSTKAGASTPATPVSPSAHSAKSSASAQRRPERQPRRHSSGLRNRPHDLVRSTKAGASTPATLPPSYREVSSPVIRSTKAGASTPATPVTRLTGVEGQHRSTKAGASTPATRLNSAKGQYRDKPSLIHGRGSLDDDVFAAISRDFGRYPVRMVRIKRRDCLDRGPSTRGFRESLRVRR